jgi:pyrroline-5-carboxylate reductase
MVRIGFIGTGTISGAMVEGLSRQSPAPEITVSPRSEAVSRDLAERYPNVRRAASNAEVAQAEIVVLGMRPAQLEEALKGLDFAPEQIVLSLVAGLALADVQKLAPHSRVARAVPMPGIARATGPLTLYPDLPELVELLAPLGDLFVVKSEAELNMGGLSALMSSYFELMNRLISQAISSGVESEDARQFVVSLLGMLADTARRTPTDQFGKLVEEHQTKAGLNERVRAKLLAAGWFEALPEALAEVTALSWTKLG